MNTQENIARLATGNSPWHDGERQLQASVGRAEHMAELGHKVIREYMPDEHRDFYSQLPFIVTGVVDPNDQPWATLLTSKPGFIQSPDDMTLDINATPDKSDPARSGFRDGEGIGFLGIELHSRRRNRINGSITHQTSQGLRVAVEQTMGNCPKYIAHRDFRFVRDPRQSINIQSTESDALNKRDIHDIRSADTFFVASYTEIEGRKQVDVSHRGGKPGFVRVGDDGVLTVPDFGGNTFFNTLGNILLTGKAGLVFAEYETGDVLQMTGSARVVLESDEVGAFEGAQRLWTFKPTKVVRRRNALPIRWQLKEPSPYVLGLGSWKDAEKNLQKIRHENPWHAMRVTKIVDESSVIRSFYLQPADGGALVDYQAGQHLPIRVVTSPNTQAQLRTYTLSSAPSDDFYRISVKREGLVSCWLFDEIKQGDVIEARAPQGAFTVDLDETRPVVLLAGGVGITPMVSMIREIVASGQRTQHTRPVWLFQAARSVAARAFDAEFDDLMASAKGAIRRTRAQTDEVSDVVTDRLHCGRIDIDLLKAVLPFDDYDFYLCGPPVFMQAMYDALTAVGVRDQRIYAEAFGPASLKRAVNKDASDSANSRMATKPVAVTFDRSGEKATWKPEQGSLLELAEAQGLSPSFSCRAGNCGTCQTTIIAGAVAYSQPPSFHVPDGKALICCSVPAKVNADDNATRPLVLAL